MSYGLHPEAEAEHEAQFAYCEGVRAGLGRGYHEALLATVARLRARPETDRLARAPDIRLLALQGFPFKTFYRAANGVIQILAVAHDRRRAGVLGRPQIIAE